MTVTNFFVEPGNVSGDKLTLVGEEAKHLAQVLRARPGDTFAAIDGAGLKYRAVLKEIGKSSVTAIIGATVRLENEPFYQITLAQGTCRPAKMDEIVEKGTEIGVSSFIFYFSEKGYSRPDGEARPSRRLSRLERIARAAAKQCKRSIVPSINQQMFFGDVVKLKSQYDIALVALQASNSKPVDKYFVDSGIGKKIMLLVGPESGLSEPEIAASLSAGFLPVSLGPRRLRTETAAILFPALVLSRLGEL